MNKKKSKIILLTVLAVLSLLLIIEKNLVPGLFSNLSPYKNFELLGRVIYLIQNDYIEEANPAETMKGAYDAKADRLFVTGKLWCKLFEIELVPPHVVLLPSVH